MYEYFFLGVLVGLQGIFYAADMYIESDDKRQANAARKLK
jgi:hypothetical protein